MRDDDPVSSSLTSTTDSTSTTVFDVTKVHLTISSTTSDDESSTNRLVSQKSTSEVHINVHPGQPSQGLSAEQRQGPYNMFLPSGTSVPVIFTSEGIRFPGYNGPTSAPAQENDDSTTTSTTTTEQQDAMVAGVFQLLPAGSYLPTFVNMEQIEEEGEEDESEKPVREAEEQEVQEEPAVARVVETAMFQERETFFQMPQQEGTVGSATWQQVAPSQVAPPRPMLPPMYAQMAPGYAQQYGMFPPMSPLGWQGQQQAYAQALGMTFPLAQPQWMPVQGPWPGMQWQPSWPPSQYGQETSQFLEQRRPDRAAARDVDRRQVLERRVPGDEFVLEAVSSTEVEFEEVVSSPLLGVARGIVSTSESSLLHVEVAPGVGAEPSTRAGVPSKRDGRSERGGPGQTVQVSASYEQITAEVAQATEVTQVTTTGLTLKETQSRGVVIELHDMRPQAEVPGGAFGMEAVPEPAEQRAETPRMMFAAQAAKEPAEVASKPAQQTQPTLGIRLFKEHAQSPTFQIQVVPQPTDQPQATFAVQTCQEEFSATAQTHTKEEVEETRHVTLATQTVEHFAPPTARDQRVFTASVQGTSRDDSPKSAYTDTVTQVTGSLVEMYVPEAPNRCVGTQVAQSVSIESVTRVSQRGQQTVISIGQQGEGLRSEMPVPMPGFQQQRNFGTQHGEPLCPVGGQHGGEPLQHVRGQHGEPLHPVGVQHGGESLHPVRAQHGEPLHPVRGPSMPPGRPLHNFDMQCDYTRATTSVTAMRQRQDSELQQFQRPPEQLAAGVGAQCWERIVPETRSLHDFQVQVGRLEPVRGFVGDAPVGDAPFQSTLRDFGAQCVIETEGTVTRDAFGPGDQAMHGIDKRQVKWPERDGYPPEGVPLHDFGVQYDYPAGTHSLPTTAQVFHGAVNVTVGNQRGGEIGAADYRFNTRPVSQVCSRPSFMFGRSTSPPHMTDFSVQISEAEQRRPLSPAFGMPAPQVAPAAYPCVAVCSRNMVAHPCTLTVGSHPGRLSPASQNRDAALQTDEPLPAPGLFGRARSPSPLQGGLARGFPFEGEAGFQEGVHQIRPMSALSRPTSPTACPPGMYPLSPSTSRSPSPTKDAALQAGDPFDAAPIGGPFRQHDDFFEHRQHGTLASRPSHEIMIQADMSASAGGTWGPWPVQRVGVTATTAVEDPYVYSHLAQALQTRGSPPSPPPLSPPPRSPHPVPSYHASRGWSPVGVEQTIEIGGELARYLVLKQPLGVAEKGVSEEPAWDWAEADEQSSSGGGDVAGAAALGAFAGESSGAPATAGGMRRSSIETTSNVSRSAKAAAILPEFTVACFLLALLLVLVASAALMSWTTRRHMRIQLANGSTTKRVSHFLNATYVIPPFSILPDDRALQNIDVDLHINRSTGTSRTPSISDVTGSISPVSPTARPPGSIEICNTEFCDKEGQMLIYLAGSNGRPCEDFYEYVCGQWAQQQPAGATYADVDGALASEIEARMHDFLNGPSLQSIRPLFLFWSNCNRGLPIAQDRVLSHIRSLGLELPGSRAPSSPERLLTLAVTLAQEFGLFAVLTAELDRDPEGKVQHIVAVDEPELAWGRMKPPLVTSPNTIYWNMLVRAAEPLAALLLSDPAQVKSAAETFARITMEMTNASVAHRHLSDRMGNFEVRSYQELNKLHPLLDGLFGSSQSLRPSSKILVKAPRFVSLISHLLDSDREALHQYMVLLALLHLAPFLDMPDVSNVFLSSLTGEAVTWGPPPPRWRLCLRAAERTLPNLMQVAYEHVFKGSLVFDEVMGDIMVEEVRNGLVEFIDSLDMLDAWSKIIAKIKLRNTKVYTFYPMVLSNANNLAAYVKKLGQSVSWDGDIMEYYIRLRGFLSQMKERDETLNFFLPRWKHSVFDPECVYYPQRDVVYVPVGFFNLTVPTSPRERMFHVPRSGPRLVSCFFRVLLENTNLYEPEGLWWTEATRAAVQDKMNCLEEKRDQMIQRDRGFDLHGIGRRLNLQGLSDIEDAVAVRVSIKVYDDRLFTNRYLNRDYRLPHVPHLSSRQLFFIYLARSHCEVRSTERSIDEIRCSYKSRGKYRTNLPLSNSPEFAEAFQCSSGSEMNPSSQCSVWS